MENKKNIEQNFNEVEKIIEAMQKEDVTLDESFKLYNQGLKIIKDCNQQIETIEKQIKIINEVINKFLQKRFENKEQY